MRRLSESRIFQHFWAIAGAVSIRVKVLGIVLGSVLLLGFFISLQMRSVLNDTLNIQLQAQGLAIADHLNQHTSELLEDKAALTDYLLDSKTHYSNTAHSTHVAYIVLSDATGNILAHTFEQTIPPQVGDVDVQSYTEHDDILALQIGEQTVFEIASPLADTNTLIRLGLATDRVWETVNTVSRQILYITLLMVLVGFGAATLLTAILTRPILSLVEATRAVSKGDFSRRVPRWADDEIGDLAEAFNVMTSELEQADKERVEREKLRADYIRGVIVAQEAERKRIARELHDSTSQSLTSLLVGLRNLEKDIHNPNSIEPLRKVVSDTLEEVHALSWQLRPSVLDDLGLLIALQRYMDDFPARFNIYVDFIAHGLTNRLPMEMETSIYRIVQEALTNVVRHAKATTASVLIEQRENVIRVIVEDNGIGFDPATIKGSEKSFGLQGIRERANLFGGNLTLESQPGQGATLLVEIPLTTVS